MIYEDDADVALVGDPDEFVRLAERIVLAAHFVLDEETLGTDRFLAVVRAADAIALAVGDLVCSANVEGDDL